MEKEDLSLRLGKVANTDLGDADRKQKESEESTITDISTQEVIVTGMAENVSSFAEHVSSVAENVTAFAENVTTFPENVTAFGNEASTENELALLIARVHATFQYILAVQMNTYMLKVTASVGIPGNVVTLLVMLRMRPFTTSSFLFSGMAVSDLLYLCFSAFYRDSNKSPEVYKAACLTGDYLTWTCTIFSLIFSLALATERALAVWVPLKVSSIITMKRCVVVIGILLPISGLINLFYLFMYKVEYNEEFKRDKCFIKKEMDAFFQGYWWYISIVLTSLGPAVLFITCNVIILVGLRRSKQLLQQMSSDDAQLREKSKQSRQVTLMLMSGLTLFIVTNFPLSIVHVVFKSGNHNYGSPEQLWMMLLSTTFINVKDCNHALNGYCYFLTARRFRRSVIDLLTCGRRTKVKGLEKTPPNQE